MIGRLAFRSLTAHPIRSAVLAAGFGAGVGVMAILLGVAEVVLDQATSPALVGGGDVVIRLGPQVPARMVLSGTLQSPGLNERVTVAAPWHRDALFLVRKDGSTLEVDARAGIPSLERSLEDPEIQSMPGWQDTPADAAWTRSSPEEGLRHLDRFHPIPVAPDWQNSWAEWLYFNGHAGNARFYLTFLVGSRNERGQRPAGVRLQLDRGGQVHSYSASATLTDAEVARAPELTIGANRIRLDGMRYVIDLDVSSGAGEGPRPGRETRVRGRLTLEATPGRLIPPLEIGGARGWVTGYVVPVMSGSLEGTLATNDGPISFDGGSGYHDHNWGFWEGVSWQWGQVQHGDLSFLYGRVFPPADAADPARMPGFVGALGPDGPLGYASNVTIVEQNDQSGRPTTIRVTGRGLGVNLQLEFAVGSVVTNRMQGPLANGVDFLQMRGNYSVRGEAGGQRFDFSAPGAAETFRGRREGQ